MARSVSPRIPLELQRVFLASNAGEVIHEPPPGRIAFRIFKRVFHRVGRKRAGPGKGGQHSVSKDLSNSTHDTATACMSPVADSTELDAFDTPQLLLEALLAERGYSTAKYNAADTSFRFQPTPYDLASFHNYTLNIVQEDKGDANLRCVLEAGISPNACSRDGELLLHKACRLGKHQHVRLFLEFGADVRVCSAVGRTVLHDACSSARPNFQTFALLIAKDPSLVFMKDCRGLCPLEYIRKDHYVFWMEYLEVNVDKLWPMLRNEQRKLSSRDLGKPFSRTLAMPSNALPPELAHMIATGKMTPQEVLLLVDDTRTAPGRVGDDKSRDVNESTDDNDDDDDDDDDEDDDDDTDDSSNSSYDALENELSQWLRLKNPLVCAQ
jgi:hypothetical protein